MSMSHVLPFARSALFIAVLGLFAGCAATDDQGEDALASTDEALKHPLPTIPEALAVPAGNRLAFTLLGDGVQIYDCKAAADGSVAWVFRAPEADLLSHGRSVGSHYAGPTWEALDGSTVVGAKLSGVSVDSTAIPWLLLKASSNTGHGRMSKVTYLQRLETYAGLAPSTGCDASLVGAVAEVDYTATYAFYEASCGGH